MIASDLYNQYWYPQDVTDPQVRWKRLAEQPYGLNWLASFAKAHNKPIALPEWGTGIRPDGYGMGDDPLFIANVASVLRANTSAFAGYRDYNAGDFNGEISTGRQPLSAAAYHDNFSVR